MLLVRLQGLHAAAVKKAAEDAAAIVAAKERADARRAIQEVAGKAQEAALAKRAYDDAAEEEWYDTIMEDVDSDKAGDLHPRMEKIAGLVWNFKEALNAACTDLQGAAGDQDEKMNFFAQHRTYGGTDVYCLEAMSI